MDNLETILLKNILDLALSKGEKPAETYIPPEENLLDMSVKKGDASESKALKTDYFEVDKDIQAKYPVKKTEVLKYLSGSARDRRKQLRALKRKYPNDILELKGSYVYKTINGEKVAVEDANIPRTQVRRISGVND